MTRLILYTCLLYIIQKVGSECIKSPTTASGTHASTKICSGDLIFADDFKYLDLQKWQHEQTLGGGGNWEFQWYLNNRSNSYVENDVLHIRPTVLADDTGEDYLYSGTLEINGGSPADECTNPQWNGCLRTGSRTNIINPIKSARLRTINSFSFKYGKVEIKAKIPTGDWLWPAIWMLPRYNEYSSWPASGEIDIMESRGNSELYNAANQLIGVQQVASTLHFGPNPNYNRFSYAHYEKNLAEGFNKDYHRYQVEWTPDYLKFSIDDEQIGKGEPTDGGFWELGKLNTSGLDNPWKRNSKMAPFDQEFYIILNLAVGGTNFFPDDARNVPYSKPWSNSANNAMTTFWEAHEQWRPTWKMDTDDSHLRVDYVKVWAL